MATAAKLPFSWRDVEVLPDLERLRLVLAVLPDEEIVTALEVCRGRGRNDYPVRAMWRALIAGVVLQHASMQSLLRELGRNPALLEICGFDPLPYQSGPVTVLHDGHAVTRPARVRSTAPSHWNFSRFLGRVVQLEDEQGLVSAMIESLRAALFAALPDFGRHLGYDGKAIASHSTGRVGKDEDKTSDPDADWGKHETGGVDARTGADKVRGFASFDYAAGSCDRERRVVARLEATARGFDARYIVTSLTGEPRHLYEGVYCARGQAENLIKQHKSQLASDRTSCQSPLANQFRRVLHTAAYWLMLALRDAVPRRMDLAWAEFATIRRRLLKIGARVVEKAARVRIHLASACPDAALFRLLAGRFATSGP